MNIKHVHTAPILPVEPKARVESKARTAGASDRDANGQREQAEAEIKRHLNQQEFDDALKALGEMPGLKANNLTLKVESQEDCRVVLIVDPHGKIVRRLSEAQLWAATRDKDRQTGKLLDKAM